MYGAILGALAGLADAGSQIGNYFHNENVYRMQRAYNSPAAQVARLYTAGINPQGVTSQIASQNQGDFNKADFDFGKSFSTAASVASGFGGYQKMASEIEGLKLDNMFKTATFKDRVDDVSIMVYKHYLDALLQSGKITEQAYVNMLRAYQLEWEKYLAGEDSKHLWTTNFEDDDGTLNVMTHRSPKADRYFYENQLRRLDSSFKNQTMEDRVNYEHAKYQKVLADAARAAIALKYEEVTGSPFNSKMPWVNLLINLIRKIGIHVQQGGSLDALTLFNLIMGI